MVSEVDLELAPGSWDAGVDVETGDPRRRNPRIHSTPARYIQPAEPVYQVQPPRPTWGCFEYTSAAATYGSTRYRWIPALLLAWLIGLRRLNSSPARSPSPKVAKAIAHQTAAWVYCPPFSRTPGRYPLM